MKEIRRFTGLDRQQFNALLDVSENFEKAFQVVNEKNNSYWYSVQAQLLNGTACRVHVNRDNNRGFLKMLSIQKAFKKGNVFVVQLIVDGDQEYDLSNYSGGSSENHYRLGADMVHNPKSAILLMAPAISSMINHALGLVTKVEPLWVIPLEKK